MQPGEQPNYTLVKIRFWAKTWIWIKSQTLKNTPLKKKAMNTYAVSSRNHETLKMIACSLSSTDQNMPTYFKPFFNWNKKIIFFLHELFQCVRSWKCPFCPSCSNGFFHSKALPMHVLSNTKLKSSWQNLHLKLLLLSMNLNNLTILDSFWWQMLHSSASLPSRTLVWNTFLICSRFRLEDVDFYFRI